MHVPWYAYLEALLVGILAGIAATLAREIPFDFGRRARHLAMMVDDAAVACLLNLAMLDLMGWLRG